MPGYESRVLCPGIKLLLARAGHSPSVLPGALATPAPVLLQFLLAPGSFFLPEMLLPKCWSLIQMSVLQGNIF